jgi:nitrate reductase gamma subunit
LGFWGTVGRMFTLRQGKRLFGLVDTGQILGIILISYVVPVLLSFKFETKNLLLISSGGVLIALFFQFIIIRQFKFREGKVEKSKSITWKKRISEALRNRYLAMMGVFVGLSVVTAFFVHYSFLTVLNDQYPVAIELGQFFGVFMGTLMVFTIIIKTFVYGRLMKTYGLKISLAISPFLIGFFTLAAILAGTVFGYTTTAANFLLFFLIIMLSKLFSKSLKDSIEAPSTINEVAALSSGLILALFGSLEFFKLIHFSYVLGIIIVVWVFISLILYKEYRNSLKKALTGFRESDKSILKRLDIDSLVKKKFKEVAGSKAILFIKMARLFNPGLYELLLINGLKHDSLTVRGYVVELLTGDSPDLPEEIRGNIFSKESEFIKKELPEVNKYLKKRTGIKDYEQIENLIRSNDPGERIKGVRLLKLIDNKPDNALVLSLLRDLNPAVKKEAIDLVSILNDPELVSTLVDFLPSNDFYSDVFQALVKFGDKSLAPLEQYFHKSGVETNTLLRIIRIYGLIGNDKAIEYILSKLTHHNHYVMVEAVQSLRLCGFQAGESDIALFQQVIEKVINVTAWNIAAIVSVDENVVGTDLLAALEEELLANNNLLFDLLSLLYEPQSVYHIRENLDMGTSESVSFALELLDLIIPEELKPKLFPLLDDISREEKIKQLQDFYPVAKMNSDKLLLSIINRDYNKLNNWTKACAIMSLRLLKMQEIPDDLVAQLFNPDPLLREVAVLTVKEIDPGKFNEYAARLPGDYKTQLSQIIDYDDKDIYQLLEKKILFLKKTEQFAAKEGVHVCRFAKKIKSSFIKKDSIISNDDINDSEGFYWIIKGKIRISMPEGKVKDFAPFGMFHNCRINGKGTELASIKAMEDTFYYKITSEELNKSLFDFPEIAEIFVKCS